MEQHDLLTRFCECVEADAAAPRALVVVAHPDDEVIGAGVRLAGLGRKVTVLIVTDGAPRNGIDAAAAGCASWEAYASVRRAECVTAAELLGLGPGGLGFLGWVDQEASFHLGELAARLAMEFRRRQPEVVLTHAYEGGHPDHDATAFGVHAACARLRVQREAAPLIIEMTGYHWSGERMVTGDFLGAAGVEVWTREHSEAEQGLKRRLFAAYATQGPVLQSFSVEGERFRRSPGYDFAVPPHGGSLFYELFEWGIRGVEWRQRAGAALAGGGVQRLMQEVTA